MAMVMVKPDLVWLYCSKINKRLKKGLSMAKICLKCSDEFEAISWDCPSCHFSPKNKKIDTFFYQSFLDEDAQNKLFFDKEDFAKLVDIESNSFWFSTRNRLILQLIKKYCPRFNFFLEVGSGTGYVLNGIMGQYPTATYTALEIYAEAIPCIFRRIGKQIDMCQLDARHLVFKDEFDLIGSFDVLEHIDEDISVIEGIYRGLKNNGMAIIAVPQHPFLWSETDDMAYHKRRYRRGELEAKLKQAGFKIIFSTSYLMTLSPLIFLSRFLKVKAQSQHAPGAVVDKFLKTMLAMERFFISLGCNLPFGGSRFVVVQKKESN